MTRYWLVLIAALAGTSSVSAAFHALGVPPVLRELGVRLSGNRKNRNPHEPAQPEFPATEKLIDYATRQLAYHKAMRRRARGLTLRRDTRGAAELLARIPLHHAQVACDLCDYLTLAPGGAIARWAIQTVLRVRRDLLLVLNGTAATPLPGACRALRAHHAAEIKHFRQLLGEARQYARSAMPQEAHNALRADFYRHVNKSQPPRRQQ
jgi:hypothetical protein